MKTFCHYPHLSYTNTGSCFKENLFPDMSVQIKYLWNKCCFNVVIMKATVYWEPDAVPRALSLFAHMPSLQSIVAGVLLSPSLHMEKLRHAQVEWFVPDHPDVNCRTGVGRPVVGGHLLHHFFFFPFLEPHPQHMEVPRLEVSSELQLVAHATATAMQDPSRICNLRHSSWQRWILNPLSKARDGTHSNLMVPSWIHFRCAMMGTSSSPFYYTAFLHLGNQWKVLSKLRALIIATNFFFRR